MPHSPLYFLARLWGHLPFFGRLLATASFALLVAGAAMLFVSARQEARDAHTDMETELAQELETLPAALAEVVVIGDFASLQQQLDRYVTRPRVLNATFIDASLKSLRSSDKQLPALAPDWFTEGLGFYDLSGQAVVVVGGRDYGSITLTLGAQGLANRAWQRLLDHLAILLLAVALDFLGLWLILRNGLAPLKRLKSGAQALAAGALDTRLTLEGSPELRQLITAFNDMAEATQSAQERLRLANADLQRFAEVTAHHLQEPARRLASYADRLSQQLAERRDDAEAQLSLTFIGQQARRMKKLLGDVELFLAADQARGKIKNADVGQTVARILEGLAARIEQCGARINIGDLPPARIDAPRLADVFESALDNALLYSGLRAQIRIDGERAGILVRYRISDNGPGIKEEYRERVFRVFERLAPVGDGSNTGIGLAIVRRVAESCGGRAWIEEAPGGGCRLIFELTAEAPCVNPCAHKNLPHSNFARFTPL